MAALIALIVLLAAIAICLRVWVALRPFKVDPNDPSRFAGAGHNWTISSETGRANNVSRGIVTRTGSTRTTTITDQFFLTDAHGIERSE